MKPPWTRRHWLAGCAALAALPSRAGGRGAISDTTWFDPRRGRELPLRIRWPDVPAPWPLVLYSHGLGGQRRGADVWGEAWAAAGMVVIHLQHPGSDSAVFRQGLAALRAAATAEQLIARVVDVRFVLDEVARRRSEGRERWPGLASGAIGMAGHSFGARTTQALAGEAFPVASDLIDTRIGAFIALSPSSGRGALTPAQSFGAIRKPFFAITGSLDGDPFGAFRTGEPRARVFEGLPQGQRALLWLDGADHITFAGNRDPRANGGLAREAAALEREAGHHAAVARLSALWWRQHLLGDREAPMQLRERHAIAAPDRFTID